ncbi:glycosyltransferase family 4 protein [Escherichia albertii]|uniref:Predicted glycosyltransferase, group I family n=1 Tax=Escherichia albertii TaxID=208962 RepID=A0A5A4U3Z1_ESCAL|nr:glycosyltransferase family 4 protein [Escherichia albertii]MCZ7516692.1 glycosyltransferase family 4 protein [Escherichia albertii]BBM62597.1 predicted glycosyltransferase, group I family [Escherichia albertii]
MKKVLFINSSFELGGIETFLVRAAENLSENVKFTLLIMSDATNKELVDKFSKYGNVIFLRDLLLFNVGKYAILRTILPLNRKKVRNLFSDIDIIHASCSFSLFLMRKLTSILNKKIFESVGVYHSREFLWGEQKRIMRKTQLSLFQKMPASNVLFMNEHTIKLYSNIFKINYFNALPIGIDVDLYARCIPDKNSGRIVSVGRLVDFKTYNCHMINYLSELSTEKRNMLSFEIYGDGPESSSLKQLAAQRNVKVKFGGRLEYKNMPSVLNGASLFIGSGTAIVEAAAAGIPSIIGVESIDQPLTYGLITDTVGLSFQEMGLDYPLKKYEKIMDEFDKLSENDYLILSDKHRKRAADFSLGNMKLVLLNYYENLSDNQTTNKPYIMYALSTMWWMMLNKMKINNERNSMYDF